MIYNLYVKISSGSYNIMGITDEQLDKFISAYHGGDSDVTYGGTKYYLTGLNQVQIFTHDIQISPEESRERLIKGGFSNGGYDNSISEKGLQRIGKNVTSKFICDSSFGEKSKISKVPQGEKFFINPKRIEDLKNTKYNSYDLSRLIRLCEELNDNFNRENFLSVVMLGRSILNHIPPLLGLTTFNEVESNYGGKSFKAVMSHLNKTMRSIADSFLHDVIRKNESLPNETQVNFSQDLDFLLAEIIRKINE
jgi:hypothetical protein